MKRVQQVNYNAVRRWVLFAIVCMTVSRVFGLYALAAMADLTVVSTVSVAQTSPPQDPSQAAPTASETVTVYSHGKDARIDTDGDGSTIILGGDAYVLDNQAKTYYKTSAKTWYGQAPDFLADEVDPVINDMLEVNTGMNMDDTDNTPGNYQTINGVQTKKYLLSGWINVAPKQEDGGSGFGLSYHPDGDSSGLLHTVQFGGGGGFGGGGMGGGRHGGDRGEGPSQPSGRIRSTNVDGNVWLANSVGFVNDKSNSVWAEAIVGSWGIGQLSPGVAKKIQNEHGLPMSAEFDFSWVEHNSSSDNNNPVVDSGQHTTVSTTVKVTSYSEQPVDPSLFIVPPTYSQTLPPTPPGGDDNNGGGDTVGPGGPYGGTME